MSNSLRRTVLAAVMVLTLAGSCAWGITIQFDYSHDTGGFFAAHPSAVAALDLAALSFERFSDNLSAIQPSFPRTWQARFYDPATSNETTVSNLVVPASALIVYVGAYDLPSSVLAQGAPGGYYVSGSTSWQNTVAYRGQSGAAGSSPTDFGPWGGSISFDSLMAWNYATATPPPGGTVDFLSVATHELAHVLGFGSSGSWNYRVSGTSFTGPAAVAEYGSAVPLSPELAHWAEGTLSSRYDSKSYETAMDPSIYWGARKTFTDLDFAGMKDIGWQVPAYGDANYDDLVNATDYAAWHDSYAQGSATWGMGDFNSDGLVDGADYTIWAQYYMPPGGSGSVPEPSCILLLLASIGLLGGRRKVRRVHHGSPGAGLGPQPKRKG